MKYSIIIPVYNAAKYLRQCLQSIIAQTCTDWHCICVNDGSTDDSLEILNTYASSDSRIEIINQANGGVSKARNAALSSVLGSDCEWIVFVDSDDWMPADFLDHINYLQEVYSDSDCFMTRPIQVDEASVVLPNARQVKEQAVPHEVLGLVLNAVSEDVERWCLFTPWGKAFKNELVSKICLKYNTSIFNGTEDALFVAEYLAFSRKCVIDFSYAGYFYRQISGSLSRQDTVDAVLNNIVAIEYLLNLDYCDGVKAQLNKYCARRCLSLVLKIRNKNINDRSGLINRLIGYKRFRSSVLTPIIRWAKHPYAAAAALLYVLPKACARWLLSCVRR